MPVDDNFRALVVAALDWTPPDGMIHALAVSVATLIHVEMLRERDGVSGFAEIPLGEDPFGVSERLTAIAAQIMAEPDGPCLLPKASPSLDAAAAEFETNMARIAGEQP